MVPSSPPSIAIIGGGISGPALALSLKKHHGITSTIYELQPDRDERGVNIALAPNAVRVLQHLGVYHEVYEDGFSYEELSISNAKSQYLATVMQGKRDNFVDILFEDGSKASANFVIGADGVHSRVRDLIMDAKMDYSRFMGIIGMAVLKEMIHESVNNVTLPNFIFGET
ncbi:kynurenine 3-monooxygenase [Trichoderma arundinaceum]|uniref:Kynurenine 3-monooxygenase n=1 Tax=Trichoderma arundinaceum TaxID=490622 RepID=A0A395NDK7_TRIAR|nr:kynurenine 3-monooxygenase [Trichoderma arundinaceum]